MDPIQLRGLLAQPLALRVRNWLEAGKLDEDGLDDALSSDARAWIDHPVALDDWASLDDLEGLVAIAATQLGGEAGIVEWADELVESWRGEASIEALVDRGRDLVDGAGFVVTAAGERLLRGAHWDYHGGRESFSVRFAGLDALSPGLKALFGACLARLADAIQPDRFDVRFEGVDGDTLVVFGARTDGTTEASADRLHRAALIP